MDAKATQTSLPFSTLLLQPNKVGRKPCSSVTFSRDPNNLPVIVSVKLKQQQQHARASKRVLIRILFAASLLKNNKAIHEALMESMSKKASVLECIQAIESAA